MLHFIQRRFKLPVILDQELGPERFRLRLQLQLRGRLRRRLLPRRHRLLVLVPQRDRFRLGLRVGWRRLSA